MSPILLKWSYIFFFAWMCKMQNKNKIKQTQKLFQCCWLSVKCYILMLLIKMTRLRNPLWVNTRWLIQNVNIFNAFFCVRCSCVVHLWWHLGNFKWSTPGSPPSAPHSGPSSLPTLLWWQDPLPQACVTLDFWVAWERIDACSSV